MLALAFSLTEFPKQPTIRSQKNNVEVAPMTERVRVSFRVKEFPGGQPWIQLEKLHRQVGLVYPAKATVNFR